MTFIKTLSYLILFVSLNVYCQKKVLTFQNDKVSKRLTKNSYTFSNMANSDLAILLIEDKKAFAYLFDKGFNQKFVLETDALKSKDRKILGYSVENLNYRILLAGNGNTFAILNIDFELGAINIVEFENEFENEIFLGAVNYKNKLFILTTNDDFQINIWTENDLSLNKVKTFPLDNSIDKSILFAAAFKIGTFSLETEKFSGVSKIDQRIPNTIGETSKLSKLYQINHKVYLTLENQKDNTLLYDINLENYEILLKTFDYPEGTIEPFKKFNSYVYEDKIYQIASSKHEMKFLIKALSGELLKSFYIDKEHPIDFKNSPIIQEGTMASPFVNKRELEETQKYLRKISAQNIGLTVLKNNERYYTTIGSFEEKTNAHNIAPIMTSIDPIGFYNPTYFAYFSYTTSKSTYFYSIFDSKFNHQPGKVEDNVFDKIDAFKKSLKYCTADYVFFHDNILYYGYFDLKKRSYNLIKF